MEALQKQVDELTAVVEKQKMMLAQTAAQLMKLQMSLAQKDLKNIPNPADAVDPGHSDDFATNEDLVQLVGELQGQLTLLEDKAVMRTANSHATEDTDTLISIPNLDGELPAEFFPANVAEFRALDDDAIVQLARFYELMPASVEEQAKWQLFLDGQAKQPDLAGDEELIGSEGVDEQTVLKLWDELALFVGVSHLKRDI